MKNFDIQFNEQGISFPSVFGVSAERVEQIEALIAKQGTEISMSQTLQNIIAELETPGEVIVAAYSIGFEQGYAIGAAGCLVDRNPHSFKEW